MGMPEKYSRFVLPKNSSPEQLIPGIKHFLGSENIRLNFLNDIPRFHELEEPDSENKTHLEVRCPYYYVYTT